MKTVIVSGSFDDMRARDIRFLQEASRYGCLHALVWGDDVVKGRPKFPGRRAHVYDGCDSLCGSRDACDGVGR